MFTYNHREKCAHKDDGFHRVPIECTDANGNLLCLCHRNKSISYLRNNTINKI